MTAPAAMKLEYKKQTYATGGGTVDVFPSGTSNNGDAIIVHRDGTAAYVVDAAGGDLQIYDITNKAAPTFVGTLGALDGLIVNKAVHPFDFDKTGRYLYLHDGNTTLYTIDTDDGGSVTPTSPSLVNTLLNVVDGGTEELCTVRTGINGTRGDTSDSVWLIGDDEWGQIDIAPPDANSPNEISQLPTSTLGDRVERAFITPDGIHMLAPERDNGTPVGKIFTFTLSGTIAQGVAIQIPDTAGPNVTAVSGDLFFDANVDPGRMWFIGKDVVNLNYFWVVMREGPVFENFVTYPWTGDEVTYLSGGSAAKLMTPTHFVSFATGATGPYHSIGWGTVDGIAVVEKTRLTSGEATILTFWKLLDDEIFPVPTNREDELLTARVKESDTLFVNFYNALDVSQGIFVGSGQVEERFVSLSTVWVQLAIYVPLDVTITDNGWEDITGYVVGRISVNQGISGNDINDRIANTGSMQFALNNFNPIGLFSPDHDNLSTSFVVGAPIRLRLAGTNPLPLKTKFLGRIESITPEVTRDNQRRTVVTCVDSIEILAEAKAKGFPVRTGIRPERIIEDVIAAAVGIPPTSNWKDALDATPKAYEFAFDGIRDEEVDLSRIVQQAVESERGFFYVSYNYFEPGAGETSEISAIDWTAASTAMRTSAIPGAVNGPKGWLALAFRLDGSDASILTIITNNGRQFELSRTAGNKLQFLLEDSVSTQLVDVTSSSSFVADPGGGVTWHLALISWDLTTAGEEQLRFYVDDVDEAGTVTTLVAGNVNYAQSNWGFAADHNGARQFNGATSDYAASFDEFLDFDVEENRRRFYTESGAVVYLGADGELPTGSQPILYSAGDVANYNVNKGEANLTWEYVVTPSDDGTPPERSPSPLSVGPDGGFRFESRRTRKNSPVFDVEADGDVLKALLPEHSAKVIHNRVQARVFPRETDGAATTVLYQLDNAIEIDALETITFTAPYRDPNEQATRVSGIEMQPPLSGTDYKFTGARDGTGADLTTRISVSVVFGGSSAEVSVFNLGPKGFLSTFKLTGRGLYQYDPVTVTKRDRRSIIQHGLSDILFELPHQDSFAVADNVVDAALAAYKDARTFIRSARLITQKNAAALDLFLDKDIGDKVIVEDSTLGIDKGITTVAPFKIGTSALDGASSTADDHGLIDENSVYVIHSIQFMVGDGLNIDVRWGLFPASVRL